MPCIKDLGEVIRHGLDFLNTNGRTDLTKDILLAMTGDESTGWESALRNNIAEVLALNATPVKGKVWDPSNGIPRSTFTIKKHDDIHFLRNFHAKAVDFIWNRCLFLTTSGRVGLGPSAMQEGDWIAALFGSRLPFVLRPYRPLSSDGHELSSRDRRSCRLVATCFIPGVMNGEATDDCEEAEEGLQLFEIW